MTDRPPGNETKDESARNLNTPGFETGTQWSEVEYSIARPSAPRSYVIGNILLVYQMKTLENCRKSLHLQAVLRISYGDAEAIAPSL